MAGEQQGKGAGKQKPFPSNWGRMTAGQKRTWMTANRPDEPPAPRFVNPAKQPTAPQQQPRAAAPQEQPGQEQPGEEGGEEYGQEQPGEEGTFTITLTQQDLAGINGAELVANLLRTIADNLCPPDDQG